MDYIGSNLPANFTGAYSPTTPVNINFIPTLTQRVYPSAVPSDSIPSPVIENKAQGITTSGIRGEISKPSVELQNRTIYPVGFAFEGIPEVRIQPVQKVNAVGIPNGIVTSPISIVTAFYRGPTGAATNFNFLQVYVQPSGAGVSGDFASTNSFYPIYVAGEYQGGVGSPIVGQSAGCIPEGIPAPSLGIPTVANYAQLIIVGGINAGAFEHDTTGQLPAGEPMRVINAIQWILPNMGVMTLFGTAEVTNQYRTITLNTYHQGIPPPVIVTPVVSLGVRAISPPSFTPMLFGGLVIYHYTALQVAGIPPVDAWGVPVIYRDTKWINPTNELAFGESFGDSIAWNYNSHVLATRIQAGEEHGNTRVDNYISHIYQVTAAGNEQALFGYTSVENGKKFLSVDGTLMSRIGIPDIYNNADPVSECGGIGPEQFGGTYVAWHTQILPLPSLENSGGVVGRAIIYNGAKLLTPTGSNISYVSSPTVINANRYVTQYWAAEPPELGIAFIAYAIRSIQVGAYPEFTQNTNLGVRINPWIVSPIGIDSYKTSATYVEEHFTIIAPSAINPKVVGIPAILNRNRVLGAAGGADQSSFPHNHQISNYIQYLPITMGDTSVHGWSVVAWRTKVLTLPSIPQIPISPYHHIYLDQPELPYPQNVIQLDTYPGDYDRKIFGAANIRSSVLFAEGIAPLASVGAIVENVNKVIVPNVFNNSLDYPGEEFGIAYLGNATRRLYPNGIPDPLISGTHMLWPHIIKTWIDKNGQPCGIDYDNYRSQIPQEMPLWGVARVEHVNRVIYPIGGFYRGTYYVPDRIPNTVYGDPSIENSIRYLYPTGFRSLRMGALAQLNPHTGYIACTLQPISPISYSIDPDTNEIVAHEYIGEPEVVNITIGPQTISPDAIGAINYTWPTVEFFNRTVTTVSGVEHVKWGNQAVHFPYHSYYAGIDSLVMGTATIGYRIREVFPVGLNYYELENEMIPIEFSLRMKVVHGVRIIDVSGIAEFRSDTQMVANAMRGMAAIGWDAEGASLPSIKGRNVVSPTAIFTEIFGSIKRPTQNLIEPTGDEDSFVSSPRMARVVSAEAIPENSIEGHSLGRLVYNTGIPSITFDGPSVTNIYGCNIRVITTAPMSLGQMGIPTI